MALAALQREPAVSTMSSSRMTRLPWPSPMMEEHLGGVGLGTLVHDGHAHAQLLGEGPPWATEPTSGGDHHGVVRVVAEPSLKVVHEQGTAQQIVHGDVEEALNLGGVEVHGQHSRSAPAVVSMLATSGGDGGRGAWPSGPDGRSRSRESQR